MSLFTQQQLVAAKHVFSLLKAMNEEQRKAAILALSTLGVLVEDGYQAFNRDEHEDINFYGYCYDILLGSTLGMRLLQLSGEFPDFPSDEKLAFSPQADLLRSEELLTKVEAQLKSLAALSTGVDKKQ